MLCSLGAYQRRSGQMKILKDQRAQTTVGAVSVAVTFDFFYVLNNKGLSLVDVSSFMVLLFPYTFYAYIYIYIYIYIYNIYIYTQVVYKMGVLKHFKHKNCLIFE